MVAEILPTGRDWDELRAAIPPKIPAASRNFSKVVVRKPWGYEYLLYENPEAAAWLLSLHHGSSTSMHCHPSKTTLMSVLSGQIRFSSLSTSIELRAGEHVRIAKGAFHQSEAISPEGALLLEVEAPNQKFDLVRINDRYGRESEGYESDAADIKRNSNLNYVSFSSDAGSSTIEKVVGESKISIFRGSLEMLRARLETANPRTLVVFADEIEQSETLGGFPIHGILSDGIPFPRTEKDSFEVLVVEPSPRFLTGAQWLSESLRKNGIVEIFGVPNQANLHLVEAIARTEELRWHSFSSEQSAGFAAGGYSMASGLPAGLLLGDSFSCFAGLSSVASAWGNSVPMVVISTSPEPGYRKSNQLRKLGNRQVPVSSIFDAVTKKKLTLTAGLSGYARDLEGLLREAKAGRCGPVSLETTLSFQTTLTEDPIAKEAGVRKEQGASLSAVNSFYRLLKVSRRPIVLLGRGVRLSRAESSALGFIETLGIPFVTSRSGIDVIPTNHRLCFGRAGAYGERISNILVQSSDLVIVLGSSLNSSLIGRSPELFAREAQLFIVDIDSMELKKNSNRKGLAVQSDIEEFLKLAIEKFTPGVNALYEEWVVYCEHLSSTFEKALPESAQVKPNKNGPYAAIGTIRELLPPSALIVAGGGGWLLHMMTQTLSVRKGDRVLVESAFESAEFAIGAAFGASVASPGQKVICIVDSSPRSLDMGALYAIGAANSDVVIISIDAGGDSEVDATRNWAYSGSHLKSPSLVPDFETIKDIGFNVIQARDSSEWQTALRDGMQLHGPTVIVLKVSGDIVLSPRPGFLLEKNLGWTPMPIEDLHPLIPIELLSTSLLIETSEVSKRARS